MQRIGYAIGLVTLMSVAPLDAQRRLLQVSSNGPYTSITAALNAARHGDTIYVARGSYEEFIVRKSVTIDIEPGTTFRRASGFIQIFDSGSPLPATIRRLEYGLHMWGCRQPLFVEKCTLNGLNCGDLDSITVVGSRARWAQFLAGAKGELYDSTFGPTVGTTALTFGPGPLYAANCTFLGGRGVPAIKTPIWWPPYYTCTGFRPGGHGVRLKHAQFTHINCNFVPGVGVDSPPPCQKAVHGKPIVVENSTVVRRLGPAHRLVSNAPVREGQVWEVDVDSAAGDLLWVFLTDISQPTRIPVCQGSLIGSPASVVILHSSIASGPTSLRFTVPELGTGIDLWQFGAQAAVFSRSQPCALSSPTSVELLDRRF